MVFFFNKRIPETQLFLRSGVLVPSSGQLVTAAWGDGKQYLCVCVCVSRWDHTKRNWRKWRKRDFFHSCIIKLWDLSLICGFKGLQMLHFEVYHQNPKVIWGDGPDSEVWLLSNINQISAGFCLWDKENLWLMKRESTQALFSRPSLWVDKHLFQIRRSRIKAFEADGDQRRLLRFIFAETWEQIKHHRKRGKKKNTCSKPIQPSHRRIGPSYYHWTLQGSKGELEPQSRPSYWPTCGLCEEAKSKMQSPYRHTSYHRTQTCDLLAVRQEHEPPFHHRAPCLFVIMRFHCKLYCFDLTFF